MRSLVRRKAKTALLGPGLAMSVACCEHERAEYVDLQLTDFRVPSTVTVGTTFTLSYTVTNRGNVFVFGEASHLAAETTDLANLGVPIHMVFGFSGLPPGATSLHTSYVTLPPWFPSGVYQFGTIIEASFGVEMPEHLADNFAVQAVTVQGASCIDLPVEDDEDAADANWLPTDSPVLGNFCHDPLDWFAFDAVGGTTYVFAAHEPLTTMDLQLELYDASAQTHLYSARGNATAGDPYTFTIPTSGRYLLKLRATTSNLSPRAAGNIGAGRDYELFVGTERPDIRVNSEAVVVNPSSVTAGATTSVGFGYSVDFAETLASIDFAIYLSTDAVIDASDVLLLQTSVPPPLVRGTFGADITIPIGTPARAYYVIARADPDDVIEELIETDDDTRPSPLQVLP